MLPETQWCCVQTLGVWTLRPVRPVRPVRLVRPVCPACPVLSQHILLCLGHLDTVLSTGVCPDRCNQATPASMHPEYNLNTTELQDLPLPLSTLLAFRESDAQL